MNTRIHIRIHIFNKTMQKAKREGLSNNKKIRRKEESVWTKTSLKIVDWERSSLLHKWKRPIGFLHCFLSPSSPSWPLLFCHVAASVCVCVRDFFSSDDCLLYDCLHASHLRPFVCIFTTFPLNVQYVFFFSFSFFTLMNCYQTMASDGRIVDGR